MSNHMYKVRRIGKGVGIAFLVLIAVHGILTLYSGHRFEAQVSRLRARKQPVTMAELYARKVPAEQNAALIYNQIFAEWSKNRKPEPNNPTDVIEEDLDTVYRLLEDPARDNSMNRWHDSDRIMRKYDSQLAMVEAAVSKPACIFPKEITNPLETPYPEFSGIRKLCKMITARAVVDAKLGRLERALHEIDLCIRMEKQFDEEGTLIGSLIKMALVRVSLEGLADIMRYSSMTDEQLKSIDRLLSSIDLRTGYVNSFSGERVLAVWATQESAHSGMLVYHAVSNPDVSNPSVFKSPGFRWRIQGYLIRPLAYASGSYYLGVLDRIAQAAPFPYREGKATAVANEKWPVYAWFGKSLLVSIDRTRIRLDNTLAQLAVTRTLLGLTAYKNRFGTFPDSLEQMAARTGWQLQEDPYSGKNLIYQRTADGFKLYSIGSNMKDDGGVPPGENESDQGDIVLVWK